MAVHRPCVPLPVFFTAYLRHAVPTLCHALLCRCTQVEALPMHSCSMLCLRFASDNVAFPLQVSAMRCLAIPLQVSSMHCFAVAMRCVAWPRHAPACLGTSLLCCLSSMPVFAAALPLNANRCYSQAFHIKAFAEHLQSMPLQCLSKRCHCKASLCRALALSCRTLLCRYFSVQCITAPMRNISAPCHSVAFPRTSSPLLLHAYHSRCFSTHIIAVALHRTAFSLPRPT